MRLAICWRHRPTPASASARTWLTPRLIWKPISKLTLPRSYIYATRNTPADTFGPFAKRARSEPGWRCYEIDASHSPNVTAPEELMALLEKIVAEGAQ